MAWTDSQVGTSNRNLHLDPDRLQAGVQVFGDLAFPVFEFDDFPGEIRDAASGVALCLFAVQAQDVDDPGPAVLEPGKDDGDTHRRTGHGAVDAASDDQTRIVPVEIVRTSRLQKEGRFGPIEALGLAEGVGPQKADPGPDRIKVARKPNAQTCNQPSQVPMMAPVPEDSEAKTPYQE